MKKFIKLVMCTVLNIIIKLCILVVQKIYKKDWYNIIII
jgi:hypothetical protein